MATNPPILTTERLTLRIPRAEDAQALPSVLNDPEIAANTRTIPYPYTHQDAVNWLECSETKRNNNDELVLFIELKETQQLIGTIGVHFRGPDKSFAELGYVIGRPWWGNGYATEASRAMVRHAFKDMGFARLTAHAMLHNPASSRVLEKIGMQSLGILKECCEKDGEYIEAHGFVLTLDDWKRNEADD